MSDQSSHTDKITAKISSLTNQQIIRQFKLNHGLILTGYNIRPSIQAVIVEEGCELEKYLYEEQPLVFTCINETPDTCINFPVFEMICNGNLSKSFLEFNSDEKELSELYGHFFARKYMVGGQLFIKDFNSVTDEQKNVLKFCLFCAYNSVKYSTKIQFSNLFSLNLLPRIETFDGEKLDTYEKLIIWMNNLYQKNMVNLISYDLVPISHLNYSTIRDLKTFNDKKWSGFSKFKDDLSLSLEKWVGNAINDNLMSWANDFNLFQGLIINKNDGIEISKKMPVNIIEIPKVNPINKFCLKIIMPTTNLKVNLISNNIYSSKDLSTFPFINVNNNIKSCGDYTHVLIKFEQYEILLNENNIRPTQEFEDIIEEALNSMKPLKALQEKFNEYGHLFPRRIVLGRLLKNILPKSITFDDINDINKIRESLNDLNIPYLLTPTGRIIEENEFPDWINNTNNNLEIIEFDDIISLYKILNKEKQGKIDKLLNRFDNCNIIITGMTKLEDLDNKNVEHYKRIDLESSLEDKDYEVFGSIISENNSKFEKLEEIYVNFGLYDFNGFYAIIKKVEETSINIAACYVSWIVIGKPSKLSVFSPKNRELQVNCIKESIKLQPDKQNYVIETSFTLHEGYTVFAHASHSSINCEPNNIVKLVGWKEKFINVQIKSAYKLEPSTNDESLSESESDHENNDRLGNETNLRISILTTDYKSLKIDNDEERECPLDLIGYVLNKENFNESLFNESDKNKVSVILENDNSVASQSLQELEILEQNKGI
jgi:hypothetical protein